MWLKALNLSGVLSCQCVCCCFFCRMSCRQTAAEMQQTIKPRNWQLCLVVMEIFLHKSSETHCSLLWVLIKRTLYFLNHTFLAIEKSCPLAGWSFLSRVSISSRSQSDVWWNVFNKWKAYLDANASSWRTQVICLSFVMVNGGLSF